MFPPNVSSYFMTSIHHSLVSLNRPQLTRGKVILVFIFSRYVLKHFLVDFELHIPLYFCAYAAFVFGSFQWNFKESDSCGVFTSNNVYNAICTWGSKGAAEDAQNPWCNKYKNEINTEWYGGDQFAF